GSFTDQGIRGIKDSPKRADAFKAMAQKAGCKVKEIYWTLGHYDIITIVEAPDAAAATSLGLAVASLGNVRTETLTAFGPEEFGRILGKMP
ncbi:MAG: GYD domain-containing protein, partial [Pseudomonadota bacterium]